jgi:Protein of unknown function (DUF2752)
MNRAVPWVAGAALGIWGIALFLFDPENSEQFLPCPFHWLTGWFCPGCGAQRAIHDLLHGRLGEAFGHNAALVCAVPLLGLQWAIGRWSGRSPAHNNFVVLAWGLGLVAWGVVRNLPGMGALAP